MAATGIMRASRNWTVEQPPAIVRHLVRWYVHDREPGQTMIDYCERVGMSLPAARKMIRDPRVLQLLDEALRESNAGPVKVQEILDMLHMRAIALQDVKAAEVYLKAVDRLIPRARLDVVHHDARGLTDAQLAGELVRAMQLLQVRTPELAIIDGEVIEDDRPVVEI